MMKIGCALYAACLLFAVSCTKTPIEQAREKAKQAELELAARRAGELEAQIKVIEDKLKKADETDPGLKAQLTQERDDMRARLERWKLRAPAEAPSGGGHH